jgi:hypothetical protein
MAKLNRLIKGQDLHFDTHQAGDGQSVNWPALHMEKRLHGGSAKLKFPLLGGFLPSKRKRMSDDDYFSILKEVTKPLKKNDPLVRELADTLIGELNRWSSGDATVGAAIEASNKIAKYFDLSESFDEVVVERLGVLSSVKTMHRDEKDKLLCEILQSEKSVVVQTARTPVLPATRESLKRK